MGRDVLIVGGGVIGLCTAYYAARDGAHVTVLEGEPEMRNGCSYGNAGMVVPSHFIPLAAPGMVALGLKWMWNPESPFYIKPRLDWDLIKWGVKFWQAATPARVERAAPLLRDLSFASRQCFEELAQLPGHDFGLVTKGLVVLCQTEQALAEEAHTAEKARSLGIPADVRNARETAQLDPDIEMSVAGSVYFPKDCHLTPQRFMAGLEKELHRLGVRFCWQTKVTGWRVQGRQVEAVQTSAGDLTASEYVICGGAWSPTVARDLQLQIPLQAGKGYSLTLPDPPQRPQICAILTEARIAVTPMGQTVRFGGTMELAGLNEEINPVRVRGIIKAVPKYYPRFTAQDFSGIKPWCGLRPCSPDGLPYVGRSGRYANLSVATGHAMMGLSLGPVTGQLMSQILRGEKPALDIGLLNPDRYGESSSSTRGDALLDLIGQTPLIPLRFPAENLTIHAKCEFLNPSGSIKDRLAKTVIVDAEKRGLLQPDSIILECSSGNTGIALSMVGAAKGYRVTILMSQGASEERRRLIRQLGAELILFASDGRYQTGIDMSRQMAARDPRYFLPRQFENTLNIEDHEHGTGQEILRQMRAPIDAFVAGYGTGGTLGGVGKAIKARFPQAQIIAMEPAEAALLAGEFPCCHSIEGVADGFIPPLLRSAPLDGEIKVGSDEALRMTQRLQQEFGLLVGTSSGANVAAALRLAAQLKPSAQIVTVLCDRAERYFSTRLFSESASRD